MIIIEHYHLFKKLKSSRWNLLKDEDDKLFQEVREKFDNLYWKQVMEIIVEANMIKTNKAMITKRSVELAKKIYHDTEIEVFPVIVQLYYGSAGKNGAFGWKMFRIVSKEIACVYSNWSPQDLLLKKSEISILPFGFLDVELCANLRRQ